MSRATAFTGSVTSLSLSLWRSRGCLTSSSMFVKDKGKTVPAPCSWSTFVHCFGYEHGARPVARAPWHSSHIVLVLETDESMNMITGAVLSCPGQGVAYYRFPLRLANFSDKSRHTFQLHLVEGPREGITWSASNWLQYPEGREFIRLGDYEDSSAGS